ncbi:sigma-70 family RNA polymerase sigma factor [Psychrobacillus sp. Sa2BUA9]|uniref:Sigma-70 family RNA polymerase sigma factor n=1 Tax=Psychrobacillus faecigallinarum TaxID=2762235 RepID=A0ABR8RAQ1_9BACI|nr:sigma-70 family RNA polymerase sigma factor [Psychrobacillus faecigallinarum]MBD7944727.1 sigma-70 family RNA polymerase sigma factor [Psychrobacillus faecigallinarum]
MFKTGTSIASIIADYQMMKTEIARLEQILYGFKIPMDNWGVAQYGLDAAMPKGSSGKSEAELKKMDVRERKQMERLNYMRYCVLILESYTNTFSDLRTNIIYDHILDGWTYRQIASELGVGVTYVKECKHQIIDIIVSARNAQNAQNAQGDQYLLKERSAV